MALGATINKVSLNIADMDRQYFMDHELTMAMHPSESAFRFVIKIIAFALNAHENLKFTKGLGADDEPEIWKKSLSDDIELWIDFGQVEEKRIRKACGKALDVRVYTYNERKSDVWWKQNRQKFTRFKNLSAYHISADGCEALINRKMDLQFTIDEDAILITDEKTTVNVTVRRLTMSD